MKLAAYRAKGGLFNRLIRLGHFLRWGKTTDISHVELAFDRLGTDAEGRTLCFSSSSMDGTPPRKDGTRFRRIKLDEDWDVFPIPCMDDGIAHDHAKAIEGYPYDWNGIARFAVPFWPQHGSEWFCSETCVHLMQRQGLLVLDARGNFIKPHKVSPGRLVTLVGEIR